MSLAVKRRQHLQQSLYCIASHSVLGTIKEINCFLLDNGPKCFFVCFVFFACVFCGPLNVYLQHTRDVIPRQKGREKQEWAISGQSTGLIPNWGVILQACVSVQSSADTDTSGRTPAPPASLFSWVQQHLAEKQCSQKEHLHDSEQPSLQTFLMKVVTVPN